MDDHSLHITLCAYLKEIIATEKTPAFWEQRLQDALSAHRNVFAQCKKNQKKTTKETK